MSNLIKGYNTFNSKPFIIDANKSEIVMQIDEKARLYHEQMLAREGQGEPDEQGFVSGLMVSEVAVQEDERYAEYITDIEIAHEAAIILNEAYDEANAIVDKAIQQSNQIKEESRQEGIELGRQEGLAAAAAEIEQLKEQLLQEQEEYKNQLIREQEEVYSGLEPRFAEVVCDLVERLTGVVVKQNKDIIMYLINNAMKDIDNAHSFVIYLSEDDYPYVEENKDKIYGVMNPNISVELYQDAKLSKNQCKIETENGLVDLSLNLQLQQLQDALKLLNA